MTDFDTNPGDKSSLRPIRSYVIRSGRLTTSQRKAIEKYWQDFVIDYQAQPIDLDSAFQQKGNLIVEIGFGMGDSLLQMAKDNPAINYLGIEVHRPGIGKLLHGLATAGLTNVKIINHDAKDVLKHSLTDESLAGIQVFFPDPWHKKRHHKRRLIQPEFVELLASKLKSGGELHLATDWEPYAEHMLAVLDSCLLLENSAGTGNYLPAGERPLTKFEKRGKNLGHGVWDLVYRKKSD